MSSVQEKNYQHSYYLSHTKAKRRLLVEQQKGLWKRYQEQIQGLSREQLLEQLDLRPPLKQFRALQRALRNLEKQEKGRLREQQRLFRNQWLQTPEGQVHVQQIREKKKERARLWRQTHPQETRGNQRLYRQNHVDQIRESRQQYNQSSEGQILRQRYGALKLQTDPNFRLRRILRRRFSNTFWKRGQRKPYRWGAFENLVGCSVDALRQHLEVRFAPGMTWDNHGTWHIDHIVPLASFDLQDIVEAKRAFHYTNLQPLWRLDNLRKGKRMPLG